MFQEKVTKSSKLRHLGKVIEFSRINTGFHKITIFKNQSITGERASEFSTVAFNDRKQQRGVYRGLRKREHDRSIQFPIRVVTMYKSNKNAFSNKHQGIQHLLNLLHNQLSDIIYPTNRRFKIKIARIGI